MPIITLITGCSSGIGLALAVRLAQDEKKTYKVYATMRNLEKKDPLLKAAGDTFDKTLFIRCLDVTVEATIKEVVNEIIATDGKIDIMVNNAGVSVCAPVEALSVDAQKKVMETIYWGTLQMTVAVIPHMKKQRSGRIINIGSIAGLFGFPFDVPYCSAKFAVDGMTLALAVELRPFNVYVSSLTPGFVDTPLIQACIDNSSAINVDDDLTKQQFDKFMMGWKTLNASSIQPLEEFVDVILKAITDEKPSPRYVSGPGIADTCKTKFVDPTGEGDLAMVNHFLKQF